MARTSKQVLAAVELLQAMSDHAFRMYEMYDREGDRLWAKAYITDSIAYDSAISILTRKDYADRMREIFLSEEPA